MALQDLTPQLRTRLSRVERAVGWFVFLATALLLFGFGYYIYQRAESKGWFKIKAPFHTYLQSSTGLNVGDPIYLMGFPVGRITRVFPLQPLKPQNVEVDFEIQEPFFRYLWTGGSFLKVNSADFLGKRQLEVTRGTNGYALVVTQPVFIFTNLDELRIKVVAEPDQWQLSQDVLDENSNLVFRTYEQLNESNLQTIAALKINSLYAYNNQEKDEHHIVASWDGRYRHYKIFHEGDDTAWIHPVESPAIADQLQSIVAQVQSALPNILALTNQLTTVLNNAALATSNLNVTISAAQPMLTNFAIISGELREPGGAINWALGTNNAGQIPIVLTNVNLLLAHTDTNLNQIVFSVGQTLNNLANLTSNLNAQVQENPNLVFGIVKTIGDADDFVQGLKHFWLLRSTFKNEGKTNSPAKK
jgi:ABC-type transporter Mla subunit MlaD